MTDQYEAGSQGRVNYRYKVRREGDDLLLSFEGPPNPRTIRVHTQPQPIPWHEDDYYVGRDEIRLYPGQWCESWEWYRGRRLLSLLTDADNRLTGTGVDSVSTHSFERQTDDEITRHTASRKLTDDDLKHFSEFDEDHEMVANAVEKSGKTWTIYCRDLHTVYRKLPDGGIEWRYQFRAHHKTDGWSDPETACKAKRKLSCETEKTKVEFVKNCTESGKVHKLLYRIGG